MGDSKRMVTNIMAVISIVFFWGFLRRLFSIISLKKTEEESDPNIDYVMLWKEKKEMSPSQKYKMYEILGDEKRLNEVGVNNPDQLTVEKIKEYTMKRVSVRGIRFQRFETKAVEENTIVYTLRAPFRLLCHQAEKLEIRKELVVNHHSSLRSSGTFQSFKATLTDTKPQKLSTTPADISESLPTARTWKDRTTAVFSVANSDQFKSYNSNKKRSFFSSQERQIVVESLILSIKSVSDKRCLLSLLETEGILEFFPVHDNEDKRIVAKQVNEKPSADKSLWNVAQYFGTEVAFYFGWISFYSSWLVIPAILGLLLHLYNNYFSDEELDTFTVLYSIGIAVWSTVYLEFWKRRNSTLSFEWNTDHLQEQEIWAEPRPQFKGQVRISPITDKPELYYPSKSRKLKYLVTYPIIFTCVIASAGIMLTCLSLSDYLEGVGKKKYFTNITFLNDYLSLLPTIAYSILVPILNVAYTYLANYLNDWENHRTTTAYENAQIFKLVLFWFINSYLSLFHIAFVQLDLARLRNQLASLLVTSQLLWNAQEILTPYIQEKYTIWSNIQATKKAEGAETEIHFNAIEKELQMPPSGPMFDEYIKIVIQFGYVTLFGCVWPLAALMALLNNQIEIRSDLWKLTTVLRRPPAKKASDIGSWYYVLEFMSLAAVITNFAFLGAYMLFSHPVDKVSNLTSNYRLHGIAIWTWDFINLPIITKLVLLLIGEHIVVGIKVLLAALIPDVPGDIEKLKSREYYRQHMMLLEVNSEDPSPNPALEDDDEEPNEKPEKKQNQKEITDSEQRAREEADKLKIYSRAQELKMERQQKETQEKEVEENRKQTALLARQKEERIEQERKRESEKMESSRYEHKVEGMKRQNEKQEREHEYVSVERQDPQVHQTLSNAKTASEIVAQMSSKGIVVDTVPSIGQI